MSDYWFGVLTGFIAALLFALISMMCMGKKITMLEQQMSEVTREHEEIKEWVEDNKTVMRTYEFFNKSWQAIIDMKENEK